MKIGDCLHFRGIQHDVCEAGVSMRTMRRVVDEATRVASGAPFRAVWPCLASGRRAGCSCDRLKAATAEDVEDYEIEVETDLAFVAAGMCPVCGEELERRGNWQRCPKCPEVAVHTLPAGRVPLWGEE